MPPPMMTTSAEDGIRCTASLSDGSLSASAAAASRFRCEHRGARQPHRKAIADTCIDLLTDVRGEVRREDLANLLFGARRDVESALLSPLVRALAIADRRIEVSRLHQAQRLIRAEEVARTLEADLPDGL